MKVHSSFSIPQVYLLSFFFCRILSRKLQCIHLSCLLLFLTMSVFLTSLFFFWWLWQFWGVMVRYFVGCLSVRICLMFFTWLDRGDYGSWGGRHRGNILFLYTIPLTFLFLSQRSTNLLANPISFSTGVFPESNQLATLHNHHPGLCYHRHSLGWF